MAAPCINVCSKLTPKTERFKVTVGSFENKVQILKSDICNKMNLQNSGVDFDIIYCGKVLTPANQLSNYMLQNNSTVLLVKKFTSGTNSESNSPVHPEGATCSPPDKGQVLMAMHSALRCADYKSITEEMINNPVTVANLMSAAPGLDQDPVVLSMLQQPELLAVVLHKNSLDSLLQKHPSFGAAALKVASFVKEESAKRGSSKTSENLTYSLDQMSDEEDDDAPRTQQRGAAPNITTSQLAAAIQAVTGTGSVGGAFSSPSTSQGAPGPSSSSTITSDFFQQAMAHAQSASSDSALQQLREMGITDENVARQALAATGGDIQAAIDLVFGDGMM